MEPVRPGPAEPRSPTISGSEATTLWIILVTVLAMIALGVGLFRAAIKIDNVAAHREEQLVTNGLKLKDAALRDCMAPNTVWDEAVAHLEWRYDTEWAATNVGQYYTANCAIRDIYVVDADGRIAGAWRDGEAASQQVPAALAAAVDDLVAAVRTREALRGPFPARPPQKALIAKPINETNVFVSGDGPLMLSANLVQPDFGTSLPKGTRAPIIVTVQPIDDAYLEWLRNHFLIHKPTVDLAPFAPVRAGSASVEMKDRQGRPSVRFTWNPDRPARALAAVVAPSIGVLMLLLSIAPVVTIGRDRAQTRRLREAMAAANAASVAKSRFIANMSHEIRTPMNGILGVLHILKGGRLDPDSRDLVEKAIDSSVLLQGLLNDVLDLSRIEEGRLEIDPQPADPLAILNDVVSLFDAQARQKGVELTSEVRGEVVHVVADGLRLRQVLLNLVSNALKFSNAGEIQVRMDVAMGPVDTHRRLRFEVRDEGIGIPAAAQPQIFGRFTQADGSVSRRFGGSGLGLSICQALVARMGGDIGFESEEGVGSTFWFELPLEVVAATDVADAVEETDDIDLTGARILVVEDNPTNRLVATRILEAYGFQVATACDGAEGLEAARSDLYDIILMDVQMPVMDGMSATRAIRALQSPAAATPIIGLTANVLASQKQAYLAAGMDDVVDKPINPTALLEAIVRAAMRARTTADTAVAV